MTDAWTTGVWALALVVAFAVIFWPQDDEDVFR